MMLLHFDKLSDYIYWGKEIGKQIRNSLYNGIDHKPLAGENLVPLLYDVSNYSNSFNPETTIYFSIQENSRLRGTTTQQAENTELSILNFKGQKVRTLIDQRLSPGKHTVICNGKDNQRTTCARGIYFSMKKAGKEDIYDIMLQIKIVISVRIFIKNILNLLYKKVKWDNFKNYLWELYFPEIL